MGYQRSTSAFWFVHRHLPTRGQGDVQKYSLFLWIFHARNDIHIYGKEMTMSLQLCQLQFAIEAPDSTKTYAQVEAMTGISKSTEIKNYCAYLVEHCGGAILKWIIAGAQKYIQNDYKLLIPAEISSAIKSYQEENDWASDFFGVSLIFAPDKSATGSELYDAYQKYCQCSTLQTLPQTVVLPRIAEHPGVTKKRTNKGMRYYGVGINKPASIVYLETRARKCRDESLESFWDELFPA